MSKGDLDKESRTWLEADLSRLGEYEPYDWGLNGPPEGQPVRLAADGTIECIELANQ